MKPNNLFYSILFMTSLAMQCQKAKEPRNPCEGKEKFRADFQILEDIGDTTLETSTVLQGNRVIFNAGKGYDYYIWKVGEDDRTWKDQTFWLYFNDLSGEIKVTLITAKDDFKWCFNDNGLDTVVKVFKVIPVATSPFKGEYVGYLEDNPMDVFTVKIMYEFYNGSFSHTLYGLPKGCAYNFKSDHGIDVGGSGFMRWYNAPGYPCYVKKIYGKFTTGDSVRFSYTMNGEKWGDPDVKKIFIGVKKK